MRAKIGKKCGNFLPSYLEVSNGNFTILDDEIETDVIYDIKDECKYRKSAFSFQSVSEYIKLTKDSYKSRCFGARPTAIDRPGKTRKFTQSKFCLLLKTQVNAIYHVNIIKC